MQILFGISFCMLLGYILLLTYFRIAWGHAARFKLPATEKPLSLFISVLIPARNEAENLPELLNALITQSYPLHLFEIIVIDDHSTDGTAAITQQYPGAKLVKLADHIPGGAINSYKKKAIEVGIAQSKGELIITTDADCYAPTDWLKTIAAFYETCQPQMIVMPVAINCSNRPIEIFQALDFMSLQGITGAAVSKQMLSMCNGANLAYTRKAFDAVHGFKGIDAIASGDDMLLMHKIASQFPGGISYLKAPGVIVQTQPVHSIAAFFNQRIRWASKADKYDDKRIFAVLLLVYLLNVMLLILPLIVIIATSVNGHLVIGHWSLWNLFLLAFVLKTVSELFFLYPVAKFFNKEKLLWLFPLAQPFHIIYTVIAGWLGKFGKYKWKGREVR